MKASANTPSPQLLDLPSNVLSTILDLCPLSTQAAASAVSRGLRAAVEDARADAAAARRSAPDRFCREGLPLVGELRRHEASPFATPVRHRQVLAAYDRASPPPAGPEGPLHAWYRRSADLLAQQDQPCNARPGAGLIGGDAWHFGEVNSEGLADGFGTVRVHGGRGSYYIGEWRGGRRHGFGLMFVNAPVRATFHGYFFEDSPTDVGELMVAATTGFSWEAAERDWRQQIRRVGDQVVHNPLDDLGITPEWVADLEATLASLVVPTLPSLAEVVPY